MSVSTALRVTLLLENKALGGGVSAEKHYVPYPGNDKAAYGVMGQLAAKRAQVLGLGAQVRAARGEVVGFDANGKPSRNYQLLSFGLATGGWPGVNKFFGSSSLGNIGAGRNVGPTLTLEWGGQGYQNGRLQVLAFAPQAASGDIENNSDANTIMAQAGWAAFSKAVRSFGALLVSLGAFQVVRNEATTKYPIVAVTSGTAQPPVLATVTVAGDVRGPFQAVPGTPCQVMQRRARRGLGTSKLRELNGIHGVQQISYDSTNNISTLQLTCTISTYTDLCRSPGFIRPVQYTQLNITDYDVWPAARGRRSRKYVVQV